MTSEPPPEVEAADGHGSLLTLALLSLLVGLGAGLVGAAFQLALDEADRLRNALIVWAHGGHLAGLVLVTAAVAAAAALASWLVRRFAPTASGSGIPQVEAVLQGQMPQAAFYLMPIKFVGGLLAIGARLALGREGPSVQMGASIGDRLGQIFRRNWPDCRVLIAAGAETRPLYFALGVVAGLFAMLYNRALLVVEMTASVRMLLPMLGACFTAMLVPTLLNGAPIYESLRAGILRQGGANRSSSNSS
jgi:chloride channel protein, CIC family